MSIAEAIHEMTIAFTLVGSGLIFALLTIAFALLTRAWSQR